MSKSNRNDEVYTYVVEGPFNNKEDNQFSAVAKDYFAAFPSGQTHFLGIYTEERAGSFPIQHLENVWANAAAMNPELPDNSGKLVHLLQLAVNEVTLRKHSKFDVGGFCDLVTNEAYQVENSAQAPDRRFLITYIKPSPLADTLEQLDVTAFSEAALEQPSAIIKIKCLPPERQTRKLELPNILPR
jgi:hypothetical protein